MIFNTFDPTDIVTGRTTRVSSGFFPGNVANWSQSLFVDDLWSLTGSAATPSPAYGATVYDIRRTLYYVNVFPSANEYANNDPYFSVTYGNINGSGSFSGEASIETNSTKEIYTQYRNLLLGTLEQSKEFAFQMPNGTINAQDIWVIAFSSYKMKDRVDEGLIQLSFSGSNGLFTLIDDSSTTTQVQTVYNLIQGTLAGGIVAGTPYQGLGLFYPQNGMVILNASALDDLVGISGSNYNSDNGGPYNYNSGSFSTNYGQNPKALVESMKAAGAPGILNTQMYVRKSEYVPSTHYFVRVKNRDFNYSNNPSFVYDGTDGVHAQGTIYNQGFVNDPRTYVTTVGLYDSNNELVAVGKLSRPAVKSFDNELLIQVRLDF